MSRRLNFPNRLHKCIANNNWNISAGISFGLLRQLLQVVFGQDVRSVSEMKLEHGHSCVFLRQWNINPLLETSPDGGVEDPWDVGGSKHQNAFGVIANSLHLNQELRLDASSTFALILGTRRAQRVHLVDKYNAGLVRARQLKEISHKLLRLTEPLGHEVGAGDGEECRVVRFGSNSFRQVWFTGSGWLKWWNLSRKLWPWVDELTPYNKIPLQATRLPVNRWGNLIGRMTASFRASFAPSKPATSAHFTFGFSTTMAPSSLPWSFFFSGSSPSESLSLFLSFPPLKFSGLQNLHNIYLYSTHLELSPSFIGFFFVPFFR